MFKKLLRETHNYRIFLNGNIITVLHNKEDTIMDIKDKKIAKELKEFILLNNIQMERAVEQAILRNNKEFKW